MADKSSFRRSEVEAQRSAELSEALKPAFGVSAQRKRRSTQDPEAAKNVPLDVARGFVSGALGQLGDLESLIRMLPGFDEKTIIPTSEEIESNLPFRSDTPVSRAMTGAGQLAGSFYGGPGSSVRAAFGLPRAIKRAGQDFAMAAGQSGPRIFIGPKAKTWDQAAADAAQRMEQAGVDPVEIWRQTGTFRGADGIQRQEISDVGAQFRNANEIKELAKTKKFQAEALKEQIKGVPGQKDLFPKALTEARRPAREQVKQLKEEAAALSLDPSYRGQPAKFVLEHPELYKAYPELADINVTQGGRSGDEGTRAAMMGGKGGMEMEVTRRGLRDDPRSSMLHEMQHAVQTLEDMAPGGNTTMAFKDPRAFEILNELRAKASQPISFEEYAERYSHLANKEKGYEDYLKSIPEVVKKMDRELQGQAAMEYYKRLAGEAEARATQFREPMGMTERKQEFPYSSYDVPAEDLIVKDPKQYAAGGKVHISDNPDTMRLELAGGGAPKAIAQRLKTLREQLAERAAAAEAIQARDRKLPLKQIPEGSLTPEAIEAEIKRMREEKGMAAGGAAKALKALAKGAKEEEKAAIKASEALGQVEGRPLLITQADRSKVGGKWLGGPGFSGLQHTRPEYKAAEAAWGVAQPATAKTILGGYQKAKKEFGAEPVMTTMLGTPTQHQSNKMVFEELHRLFKKSAKDGNLDPELLDKINTRLRMAEDKQGKPIFPEDVNILAPDFRKVANTFDRRAVASNLMGGMTVGGKKGQIIDYDEVIRHTTDPALLEAPSGALGNRMFTLSGGIVDRPDLHPAFPSILQGEDLNVMFSPVARELVMRDFIERTMREKGRTPGYMDYTRGYPPTQLITEELLTDLQKKGFAEGGLVSGISGDDLIIEERPL